MAGRLLISRIAEPKPRHFESQIARYCVRLGIGWHAAQIPSLPNGHPASEWALNLCNLEDWSQADQDSNIVTLWRAPGFRRQSQVELLKTMRQVRLRDVPVAVRERMGTVLRECGVETWGLSLDLETVSSVSQRISHHLLAMTPAFQRRVRAA